MRIGGTMCGWEGPRERFGYRVSGSKVRARNFHHVGEKICISKHDVRGRGKKTNAWGGRGSAKWPSFRSEWCEEEPTSWMVLRLGGLTPKDRQKSEEALTQSHQQGGRLKKGDQAEKEGTNRGG